MMFGLVSSELFRFIRSEIGPAALRDLASLAASPWIPVC
jgi:hypothetical protein